MQQAARRRPGRPPASNSADTRERILRVAREVFAEVGYDGATFQTIAVRADLTRPAINHYFSSKRALYREVLEQTNERYIAPAVRDALREANLVARLSSFIDFTARLNVEERPVGRFVIASILEAERHPELRLMQRESLLNSRQFLTRVVTEAIGEGDLTVDTDVATLAEVLTAVMWGVAFYCSFIAGPAELERVPAHVELLLANKLWQLGG